MNLPEKVLFEGRGWELKIKPQAGPEVEKLLSETTWGPKGAFAINTKKA